MLAPGVAGLLLAELTDEEVAVLDGLTSDERLVVLPWLDSLPADKRDIAMLTAFRSLVARGLATGPDPVALDAALQDVDGGPPSVDVTVEETIAAVLSGRSQAHRVTSCQRNLRGTVDYLYLFEVEEPEGTVLLGELVVGTGLHRYFRFEDPAVAPAVHAYLVPAPWGEGRAPDVQLPAEQAAAGRTPLELVAQLDEAELRAEVIVLDRMAREAPRLHVVFAGREMVRTMSALAGEHAPLVFRSRSAEELRDWVAQEVIGR